MALITGLPNFFTQAGPASADLNNAAKAILTQIGGQYFDPGLTQYVQAPGNLDSTNMSASAGFRNGQKKEPKSYFAVTVAAPFVSTNTPPWGTQLSPVGPFGIGCTLNSVRVYSNTRTVTLAGGNLVIDFNGAQSMSFALGSIPSTVGASPTDILYFPINIPIGPNDFVMYDPTSITVSGSTPVTGTEIHFLSTFTTFHCRSA